jgi:hypothetical protein
MLPQELRFPKPSFRLNEPVEDTHFSARCDDYLSQVFGWRNRVLDALQTSNVLTNQCGLADRARRAFIWFLGAEWSTKEQDWAARSPYSISRFPDEIRDHLGNGPASVLHVLQWRAGLVDYLSDVWDVIGEPSLSLDECNALTRFLFPLDAKSMCWFCLADYDVDALNPEKHGCVILAHVRAKWPENPFSHWTKDDL